MLVGQLNLVDLLKFAEPLVEFGSFDINGNYSDGDFSRVFSEALGLCEEQQSESGAFRNELAEVFHSEFPPMQVGRPSHLTTRGEPGSIRMETEPTRAPGEHLAIHPITAAPFDATARDGTQEQSADRYGSLRQSASSTGLLNKNHLSDWMDAHALVHSSHHCAMYCRLGMEAADLNTSDRPPSGDAGDYGPFLLRHGAKTVPQASYSPQVGDVVVFDKTSEHPYGHIEMYDGNRWVSDFMQRTLSPYRNAATSPTYTIYRLG